MILGTRIYRTIDDQQVEEPITVEFKYYPPSPGQRDSLGGKRGAGPPLEPNDPAEIEILSVFSAINGNDFELTKNEEKDVMRQCWDKLEKITGHNNL